MCCSGAVQGSRVDSRLQSCHDTLPQLDTTACGQAIDSDQVAQTSVGSMWKRSAAERVWRHRTSAAVDYPLSAPIWAYNSAICARRRVIRRNKDSLCTWIRNEDPAVTTVEPVQYVQINNVYSSFNGSLITLLTNYVYTRPSSFCCFIFWTYLITPKYVYSNKLTACRPNLF